MNLFPGILKPALLVVPLLLAFVYEPLRVLAEATVSMCLGDELLDPLPIVPFLFLELGEKAGCLFQRSLVIAYVVY